MTLQERILEVIGQKALNGRALYGALKGDQPAAVDIALNALMRTGAVTLELGHYQRGNLKPSPPPKEQAPPKTQAVVVAITTKKPATPPSVSILGEKPLPPPPAAKAKLSRREREVFDLVDSGVRNKEAARRLGISESAVSFYLCRARGKLGLKPVPRAPVQQSAPSAVVSLHAAPFPEGAAATTVGADPPYRRITFSPDLISRLIQQQRSKAEYVQVLCKELGGARQELADIEELVRIATAKELG